MRALELFSGTGSFGKIFDELGWDFLSLDNELPADINENIMTWDYKQFPSGYFDIITASPPCAMFSKIRDSWIGRKIKLHGDTIITTQIIQDDIIKYGLPLLNKTREIIDYFKPKYYLIENPFTGKMKQYITDLPFYDVDYCKYCDWGYKKKTRLWTNIKFIPKICKKDCENIVVLPPKEYPDAFFKAHPPNCMCCKKHKAFCGGDSKKKQIIKHLKNVSTVHSVEVTKHMKEVSSYGGGSGKLDRYRIPPELIKDLCMGIIDNE
tara:strand:+ start:142 stop:936 length:795 start_codon:yes stop_codon:yes gene_type:complete